MKTYTTVEDYLEVLAGMRDPVTCKTVSTWWGGFEPIISLARYDVDVLTSMSETTTVGKALTHKQGNLLCKILLKYQRQFAAKGIDVSPINIPVWRTPLRTMDYSHRLGLDGDRITIKFPFSTALIDSLKDFRKVSQGITEFKREERIWSVALTEFNLNWLYTWATSSNFEIDPEIEKLNNLILEVEQTPYKIELCYGEKQLEITNCPESMREYIETSLGGFSHDNLLTLLDASSILGFTVEDGLVEAISQQWGNRFSILTTNKEVRINPSSTEFNEDIASVLEYAIKVNRLPVVIYESDMSGNLLQKALHLYPDNNDVYSISTNKKYTLPDGVKFIHTCKPIRDIDIQLLVTSSGMLYGGEKQIMTQRSKKIVYVASEIHASPGEIGVKRKVPKLAG